MVQIVEVGIISPVCIGGLQNIIIGCLIVLIIKNTIQAYRAKKVLQVIIALVMLLCCLYTVMTLHANVKLLILFYGHPVIAYTTEEDKIITVTRNSFCIDSEFRSQIKTVSR